MDLLDLLSRDMTLRKVAGTHGGEYAGPRPWCGGRDRFRVWPHTEKPHYWCRQCDRKGDAIQYLRDHNGLSYREACERIGRPLGESPHTQLKRTLPPPPLSSAPGEAWQVRARTFTEACEHALWSSGGAKVLAHLNQRGLHDETIRAAQIGYHATTAWETPDAWGFASDHKKIWLPQGIVFPWLLGDELWLVVIRQVGRDIPKDRKYIMVSGSSNTLYRADLLKPNAPAMIIEGCLDALAIAQEARDFIAVVAAGSTTGGGLERWIGRLALASIVLVSFDADAAGEAAAAWWLKALGARAKRWRPFWDDPNAMLQEGADIRTWIREGLALQPTWWREVATWPADRREQWAEWACIMEIDGALSRDEAEIQAFRLVRALEPDTDEQRH